MALAKVCEVSSVCDRSHQLAEALAATEAQLAAAQQEAGTAAEKKKEMVALAKVGGGLSQFVSSRVHRVWEKSTSLIKESAAEMENDMVVRYVECSVVFVQKVACAA
jgi:hypothetical protein